MTRLHDAIARLDAEQAKVCEWTPADGNLRVVASAGSGKTTTLTTLLARLLTSQQVDPSGLLLETFANKAAKVLQQRIGSLVPTNLLPERVGTFHAQALRRLRRPSRYPPPPHRWDMAQCMDVEGRSRSSQVPPSFVLWRCATEFGKMPGTDKPSLKCAGSAEEVQQYARFADLCRSRMCGSGAEYAEIVSSLTGRKIKPPPEFDEAWALVREAKTALRAWDFTDALETYAERLRSDDLFDQCELIAVDEAQDCDLLQMDVVNSFYKQGAKVLLIGDGSQAIHVWKGATPEIFAEADKRFNAKTLYLVNNYRSVPGIVEFGNAVCDGKPWKIGPHAKAVRSAVEQPAVQVLYKPPAQDASDDFDSIHDLVAEEIAHDIAVKGESPQNFAILTRNNAQLTRYQAALTAADIPHVLVGVDNLFAQREIETFVAWCVAAQCQAYGTLERITKIPNRFLGKQFVEDVGEAMRAGRELIPAIEHTGDVYQGKTQVNAYKLAEDIRRLSALPWDQIPDAVLAMLLKATEKTEKMREGASPDEDRPGLFKAACSVVKRFPASLDAVDFIDRVTSMVDDDVRDERREQGKVVLSTSHRAKGREWRHVYIDASSGSYPSTKSGPHEIEDERRLFYVAATRGMDSVRFAVADQPCEFLIGYAEGLLRQAGWTGKGKKGGKK